MSTRADRSPRAGLVWLALTVASIGLWAVIIWGAGDLLIAMTDQPAPAPASAPTIAPAPNSAAAIQLPASVIDQLADDSLAPCAQEDSHDCYWDAPTRGNGHGLSFIDWHGVVYYPSPIITPESH